MSYCTSCGAQLTGARYCTSCGALVTSPPAAPGPAPATVPAVPSAGAVPGAGVPAHNPYPATDVEPFDQWLQQQQYANLPVNPPPRRTGLVVAAVVATVLVLASAVLVIILFQRKNSDSSQQQPPVVTAPSSMEDPTPDTGKQPARQTKALMSTTVRTSAPSSAKRTPASAEASATALVGTPPAVVTVTPTAAAVTVTVAPPTTLAPVTVTVAPPPPDPQTKARQDLDQARAASLQSFEADSRWVVQLASKWVGISDPKQVAMDGSHVFSAVDIYNEYRTLRDRFGPSVLLLHSTDTGKQRTFSGKPDSEPLWVTIYYGSFGSRTAANQWCRQAFASLPADQVVNHCFAKQAVPPYTP